MAKTGRNQSCPCGSGKKYKHCCLARDEAASRVAPAPEPEPAPKPATVDAGLLTLAGVADDDLDDLTEASNAVVALIRQGHLDEAERAAQELVNRSPDVHDGYDRLGMVYEARGDSRQAADYYRQVITLVKNNPDDYDPAFTASYQALIDRLDPSPPT